MSGEIVAGDKKLQGSIDTVKQSVVTLDKSTQTITDALQAKITEGDKKLQGNIDTVKQSVVNLTSSTNTIKETLEGKITTGDKTLQSNINTVKQSITNLSSTVNTVETTLEGKITAGDKTVTGKVNQVAQSVTDLTNTVNTVRTTLEGKIQDGDEVLEGAIQENMELVMRSGDVLLEKEGNITLTRNQTYNYDFGFINAVYPNPILGFVKCEVSGLAANQKMKIVVLGKTFYATKNGSSSFAIAIPQRVFNVSLINTSTTNLTVSKLRICSQESKSHYAQWGVKSEVAGLKGGIGFINDGTKVVFAIDVDQFVMLDRRNGSKLTKSPFYVQNNQVFIDKAAITSAQVADTLTVGSTLTAPKIVSGAGSNPAFSLDGRTGIVNGAHLRGGDLGLGAGGSNSGYNTFIDSNGWIRANKLTAKNVDLDGKITARNGDFYNVTIHENCKVKGTIDAKQVKGVKTPIGQGDIIIPRGWASQTFTDYDTGIVMNAWGDSSATFLVEYSTWGGVESGSPHDCYWSVRELAPPYIRTWYTGRPATLILGGFAVRVTNGFSTSTKFPHIEPLHVVYRVYKMF